MTFWQQLIPFSAVSCHSLTGRPHVCICDPLAYLSDLDGLPDSLCCPVRLTADGSHLFQVDDVILCVDVIHYRRFTLL